MKFTVIGLLLLAKYTYSSKQNFTLSQPATSTGPSITCQGSDVTLRCVILRNGVAVDPDWRRNGTLVDTNVLTNHQIVFNSTYNAVTDLVITNVGLEDDNTEYECTTASGDVASSVVLNVTGIPLFEIMPVNTGVCSTLVRLSSSINDVCGPIGYSVQLLNNDRVLKNMTTDDLDIPMPNLVPDTNYTIRIVAMHIDIARVVGMTQKGIFNTTKPTDEIFNATWRCNEANSCGIIANWITITGTNENCSPIVKLALQGHNASSSDIVTVDSTTTTTRSYTALIWVNQMITNAVLIGTYDSGITRSSNQIDYVAGSNFLLHTLKGKLVFTNKEISVNAKWRGATNLGITYEVSLACNNSYTKEEMVVDKLVASFTVPQDVTVDNIECEVNVSIHDMQSSISILLKGNRTSTSPSTDNYCEDNPAICIGIPVVVATAILIVLAVVVLLFAHSNSRRTLLSLFHQNSKTSVVSKTQTTDNEYVTVTEDTDTNVQPSGQSDAISLQNTDSAVAAVNERSKYVEVTLAENLPIHIPPNNVVPYAQIQH